MATILAANTGNWSATGTWTGGVVPVAGDIVVANGKTITVNQNVTVAELRNDTTGGATVGGQFQLTNGVVVNANVIQGATSTACVLWAGSAGQTVTLTGAFTGGSASNASAVSVTTAGSMVCQSGSTATGGTGNAANGMIWTSSGFLTFTGTASGGNTGANSQGIAFNGSGSSLTFNGTINGGGNLGGNGIALTGNTQSFNITATIIGASTTALVVNSASSTGTITGTCAGGTGANSYGVSIANMATCSITGDCYSGSGSSSFGVQHQTSTGTLTLTGNIFGHGTQTSTHALTNDGSGTTNVSGTATAGNASNAVRNNSTGILRITRAVGNGFGLGSVGISSAVAVNSAVQGALTYIEELEFGSLGNTPVNGTIRFTSLTNNKVKFTTTTGSFKTLIDTTATAGIVPNASDVRSGTVYNSGNSTGTCAVPSPSSVALNVPVGNTVGTAFLNASDIRPAIGLASANLDTQLQAIPSAAQNASAVRTELTNELARVNNCATVATTGQQIQNAFQ